MNGGSLAAEDVSCGFFFAEHEGTRQAGSLNEEEFAAALQDILVAMVKEHYAVTRALSFLVIQSCFVPFFLTLVLGGCAHFFFLFMLQLRTSLERWSLTVRALQRS